DYLLAKRLQEEEEEKNKPLWQRLFNKEQWGTAYDLIARVVGGRDENEDEIMSDTTSEVDVEETTQEMENKVKTVLDEIKHEEETLSNTDVEIDRLEHEIEMRNKMSVEEELEELENEMEKQEMKKREEEYKRQLQM